VALRFCRSTQKKSGTELMLELDDAFVCIWRRLKLKEGPRQQNKKIGIYPKLKLTFLERF